MINNNAITGQVCEETMTPNFGGFWIPLDSQAVLQSTVVQGNTVVCNSPGASANYPSCQTAGTLRSDESSPTQPKNNGAPFCS